MITDCTKSSGNDAKYNIHVTEFRPIRSQNDGNREVLAGYRTPRTFAGYRFAEAINKNDRRGTEVVVTGLTRNQLRALPLSAGSNPALSAYLIEARYQKDK